jgi:glycoprotein endo-alpha-1,2-mannosidase
MPDPVPAPEPLVLAFHYAWYETPWGPGGRWAHWDEHGHLPDRVQGGRRDAGAAHQPLDGLYDSADPAVLRRQLRELAFAGIDASVVSWWGEGHTSERVLGALLSQAQAAGSAHRVTVYYETAKWGGRAGAEEIAAELRGILDRHGRHPNWLALGDRPVLWLYVVHTLPRELWARVREALAPYDPVCIADVGDGLDPSWLDLFEGYHTYNPLGTLAGGGDLAGLYRRAAEDAHRRGRLFAGTVLPGYDDRMVRDPGTVLPRRDGGTYLESWRAAEAAPADWIVITSYNEWHEGSEIEPSVEYGADYLAMTRQLARAWKRRRRAAGG